MMSLRANGARAPAVTGMGAVSAVGIGCLPLRLALDEGRDGIAPIIRFSTEELTVHLGGMVADSEAAPAGDAQEDPWRLCVEFALKAAREAWAEARVADAGLAPENFSGRLRQFGPHLVILIDAAHMGGPAGEIRLLAWEQATSLSASTHTLPLSMFSSFITTELGCQVALLGIQPQQIGPGQPFSLPVRNAVRRLTRGLARVLQE